MYKDFESFFKNQLRISEGASILLALSGGVDSSVLADLFYRAGLKFGVAHVNYQLRGNDSDLDAELSRSLADTYGVPYHEIRVAGEKEAQKCKQSIQLFARNFRYNWFEKLSSEHGYDFIATAHHADDSLETAIYNLTRGTGLTGLAGVPMKRGKVIRPMLFTYKKAIIEYAKKRNLAFRKDQSNDSVKYDRNKIRKEVVPRLKELNPSLNQTVSRTFEHIRGGLLLYQENIERYRQDLISTDIGLVSLLIKPLMETAAPSTLLFELLAPYGLNSSQASQLFESILAGNSGKTFSNADWEILLDREKVLVRVNNEETRQSIQINLDQNYYKLPDGQLEIRVKDQMPILIPKEEHIALVDLNKLEFPLTLRRWKEGDVFHPLGMGGHKKKVQDFFTDQKMDRFAKKKVWILESARQIVWIVGLRLDESYKLAQETTACLELTYFQTQ